MNKATIYFHSGTGNSFRVARWMAETAQAHGLEGEVVSIHRKAAASEPADDRAEQVEEAAPEDPDVPAPDGDWVALVAPAHAFTASWAMLKFALRMERGQGRQAAVVLTRAGTKFGKRRFPGLEGTGCYVLAGILAAKGYRVRGTLGVDMPSNWTQLHPGFAEPAAADIIEHAKAKTKEFTAQVVTGRRRLGGWLGLVLGILLLPITVAYLAGGRFLLGKIFFASPRCTGCGQCARTCPNGSIRMIGWRRKRPYWSMTCQNCMRCMAYCPERAVEAGWSWAALLYYTLSVPGVWLMGTYLLPHLPAALAGNRWTLAVIGYLWWLVSMAVAYALFQLLLRIPPIHWLFTLTTPTHVFRRYHEPETSLEDLQ